MLNETSNETRPENLVLGSDKFSHEYRKLLKEQEFEGLSVRLFFYYFLKLKVTDVLVMAKCEMHATNFSKMLPGIPILAARSRRCTENFNSQLFRVRINFPIVKEWVLWSLAR